MGTREALKNPELPPGAIVETYEDGGALRNDGVRLTPASQNPWYVLATVAGEQDGKYIFDFDAELHAKNRRFWNGWMCQALEAGERTALAEKLDLPEEELTPLSAEEKAKVEARFKAAFPDTSSEEMIPNPDALWVDFRRVYFAGTFVLGKCHFTGLADFREAHFNGAADFQVAHFTRTAVFHAAQFTEYADFREAQFSGLADFQAARFHKVADFSDGSFKAKTVFDEVVFKGEVPDEGRVPAFFHREMHQDTSFTDDSKLWPEVTAENAKEGKRAYTRLRQVAAEIYDPDLEHFFLRQEMRCKARIEWDKGAWFHWLFFEAYRVIADSGISVARPFWLLVFAWAFGFACFAGHFDSGVLPELPEDIQDSRYRAAAGVSFGNLFGFLGINRLYFTEVLRDHSPDGLQLVAGAQTVAGVVLLFFLGLGLRNRFRLK